MPLLRAILCAALVAAGGGAAASLRAEPVGRASSPLVPLTDADETATTETGCTTTFSVGARDYLQLVGTELMLRDGRGLHRCRLTEASSQQFGNGRGGVACSGYRLGIRQTGRPTANAASDSSSTRAVLTMGQGGGGATLRGIWGVAC